MKRLRNIFDVHLFTAMMTVTGKIISYICLKNPLFVIF